MDEAKQWLVDNGAEGQEIPKEITSPILADLYAVRDDRLNQAPAERKFGFG